MNPQSKVIIKALRNKLEVLNNRLIRLQEWELSGLIIGSISASIIGAKEDIKATEAMIQEEQLKSADFAN